MNLKHTTSRSKMQDHTQVSTQAVTNPRPQHILTGNRSQEDKTGHSALGRPGSPLRPASVLLKPSLPAGALLRNKALSSGRYAVGGPSLPVPTSATGQTHTPEGLESTSDHRHRSASFTLSTSSSGLAGGSSRQTYVNSRFPVSSTQQLPVASAVAEQAAATQV
jgi:hypothetical protein